MMVEAIVVLMIVIILGLSEVCKKLDRIISLNKSIISLLEKKDKEQKGEGK